MGAFPSLSASSSDSSSKSLETALSQKTQPVFSSSFSVGSGSSANSSPTTGDGAAGVPMVYVIIGAAVALLLGLVLVFRRK